MNNTAFVGVVRLNDEGEMLCFCYQKDVDAGLCDCRRRFDCPEARVEISIIPGTRPSEVEAAATSQASRSLSKSVKDTVKGAEAIKQGLAQLEKSIQKNSRFRV